MRRVMTFNRMIAHCDMKDLLLMKYTIHGALVSVYHVMILAEHVPALKRLNARSASTLTNSQRLLQLAPVVTPPVIRAMDPTQTIA